MAGFLDDDALALWQKEAQEIVPIVARKRIIRNAPAKVTVSARTMRENIQFPTSNPHPLALGAYAGIDRSTAEKFRKGKYPLDATLDLHGMSRQQAHMALSGFVQGHYAMGSRCLLVVTGKGSVLRELLPGWLDEPGLRAVVLALVVAARQHGGSGAYSILLRRKR